MKISKIIGTGIFLLVVSLLCCSCNGNMTRDIRHAGFSIGSDFKCSAIYPSSKEDTSYQKVWYFDNTHLITNDGYIYEVSFDKIFANGENCKKAETSLQVSAILDDSIIRGTDGGYYYLSGKNDVLSYSEVTEADNAYNIYDLLLKDDSVLKVMTADSSNGIYYVLKDDGNVYAYGIASQDRNSPPTIVSSMIVYSYADYGGNLIIDFSYRGDNSQATYIRTSEHVFRMKITNYDTCSKYSDVACEYNIQQELIFDQYSDRIIAYNGEKLITDYKKVFTLNG